uniref:Uncharacterized protein n=1 Tax=Romanomermis culicivorax TaxID=13658 RepID=A0A915KM41_ROMCU
MKNSEIKVSTGQPTPNIENLEIVTHFALTNGAFRRTKWGTGRNSYDNTTNGRRSLNVGYTKLNAAFACK